MGRTGWRLSWAGSCDSAGRIEGGELKLASLLVGRWNSLYSCSAFVRRAGASCRRCWL